MLHQSFGAWMSDPMVCPLTPCERAVKWIEEALTRPYPSGYGLGMSTTENAEATTTTPDLIVQVGQGAETHLGIDLGRGILATVCGTNGRRIVKVDAADSLGRPDYVTCERCNPRTAV